MFTSLHKLVSALGSSTRSKHRKLERRPKVHFRPRLEAFEDRVLLSTYKWFTDVNGSWNDATKWEDGYGNHGIPQAGDTAIIGWGGPYGPTVTVAIPSSVTVGCLQSSGIIELTGGSLSVTDSSQYSYTQPEFDMAAGTALNVGPGVQFTQLGTNQTISNLAGNINVGAGASLTTYGLALSAALNAAAGSTVYFDGSTQFNAGAALVGSGLYDLASNNSTLVLNASAAPQNLMIAADDATVQGTGNLSVGTAGSAGAFTFAGGTLEGSGTLTVPAGATFTVASASGHNLAMHLDNHGTFAMPQNVYLGIGNTTTLTNEADGVINLGHSAAQINPWATPGLLENYGRINVSTETGVGTVIIYCTLDNQGVIDLQGASTLNLGGPVSSSNGVFEADNAAGTILMTYGGTSTLSSGTRFQGPGFTHYISGDNGVLDLSGAVSAVNFQQDSGNIVGDSNDQGSLTITGTYNWNYQSLGGGGGVLPVTIASGAVLNIPNINRVYLLAVLNNQGTVNWSGTGNFAVGSTGDIENHGQFNITSDALLTDYYNFGWLAGVFNNYGIVTKTSPVGSGTTVFSAPVFNNFGTLAVQSGTVALDGGGTSKGLFEIAADGELAFYTNSTTLSAGAKFSGLGTLGTGVVTINGGTLDANATVAIPYVGLESGTLTGTGLTVSKSLTWTGGTIDNSGSPISAVKSANSWIEGNATKNLAGATLNLSGKTYWLGSGNLSVTSNGTMNNSGTFTIENDQSITGSGTFNNTGLLTKTAGSAITTVGIAMNNGGRVEVHTAGLTFSATVAQVSGSTLNSGTWSVFSTSSSSQHSVLSFSNLGNLTTLGLDAAVNLSGPKSTFSNLSALAVNNGSFGLLAGASFQTVGAFSNQGSLTLAPAASGSTLSVAGNFTNGSSSVLTVTLAGTSSSPTYGTITATGNISLGGTLALSGSVQPAIGVPMTIIHATGSGTITGAFTDMTFSYKGMTFAVTLSGNSVVVTRTA